MAETDSNLRVIWFRTAKYFESDGTPQLLDKMNEWDKELDYTTKPPLQ